MSGTSRTEPPGGGTRRSRAARALRGLRHHLAALTVLGGLVATPLVLVPDQFGYRAACTVLTATLGAAAAMRALLPTSWVGVLAVRSRVVDTALMAGLAATVAVLAFSVPLPGAAAFARP